MTSKLIPICAAALFASFSSHAITVDSLLKFADKNGEASFTVGNNEKYRQFVNAFVYDMKVDDKGEFVTKRYTSENIKDWEVSVSPARAILDPNFQRGFRVSYTKGDLKDIGTDKLFQISFIPSPYFRKNELRKANGNLAISIGFSAIFVVPTQKDHPIHYKASYIDNTLVVENTGKSYLYLTVNGCSSPTEQNCKTETTLFSGRKLTVNLTEKMRDKTELDVILLTHAAKQREEFTIRKGQRL